MPSTYRFRFLSYWPSSSLFRPNINLNKHLILARIRIYRSASYCLSCPEDRNTLGTSPRNPCFTHLRPISSFPRLSYNNEKGRHFALSAKCRKTDAGRTGRASCKTRKQSSSWIVFALTSITYSRYLFQKVTLSQAFSQGRAKGVPG